MGLSRLADRGPELPAWERAHRQKVTWGSALLGALLFAGTLTYIGKRGFGRRRAELPRFPAAWGPAPDMPPDDASVVEVLPGGYGLGGAALAAWIAERMADDAAAHRRLWPPAWGEPPQAQTRDLRPLGFGYGMGSGTVARWIAQNAEFYGGVKAADFARSHRANALDFGLRRPRRKVPLTV
jgi:hypothetical protein